jgi:glycosyltransferase involved in cell wall biosynthesis
MKIVYIDHYAGTPALGMEYRPYHLAREWVRMGHEVVMLAASHSHVRARQPMIDAPVTEEPIDGISYRWCRTPRYTGNGIGRAFNVAAFLWRVWRQVPRLLAEGRPDTVIASSTYPLDIWVARALARRARAKLVYEVHDLWPLSLIELLGWSPRHPFVRLCQRAEETAYREADVVVSMLPTVHDHMAAHGLDLSKLTVVPNGISPEDWAHEPEALRVDVAEALVAARRQHRTVVGYAGSMGLPNALDTLLDAAKLVRGEPFAFVLVGDGHERERLEQRVKRETIANVTLLPPIPRAQVPSFLAALDIAYIGWQHVPIYRFGIAPNKLMDYMMAGCAVLHSVEAGNDPVAESGCGLTVAPESPAAVAGGLSRLAALSAGERSAMGAKGRDHVLAHHSYPVLARRFIEAIQG